MTAQQLAGLKNRKSSGQLFTTQNLLDELHHPHPTRRAAAAAAARWIIALASDRVTFWEGTRTEVWSHIFDLDRLQDDIDRGDPRRCPRDPMRAVGAQLVIEAVERVIALRSGDTLVEVAVPKVSDEEFEQVVARFELWASLEDPAIDRAA
jgi:hypothetical protein